MGNRYQDVCDVLQVFSHPVRLQILDELRTGEACVCHLQELVHRPQPYVSQQLGQLREAELVADRQDGLFVYYSLVDSDVERIVEVMLGPPEARGPIEACSCPRCEIPSTVESDGASSGAGSSGGGEA